MNRFILFFSFLFLIGAVFLGVSNRVTAAPVNPMEAAKKLNEENRKCVECHAKPGMDVNKVYDWAKSKHAGAGIGCTVCHDKLEGAKTDQTLGQYMPAVSPNKCGMCHREQAAQFKKSKHARTWEIQTDQVRDAWLKGMNSEIERATGCYQCHGSDLSSGKFTVENWPNKGIGRKNPDGSLGSCAACHTSHRFSIAEARRPETCGQCHLGPDHPQDEIYFSSKHGKRYLAEREEWNFTGDWKPGADFSAPTCAVCHLSAAGATKASHDVGERLMWEAQAPLSVLNKDLDGEAERKKMIGVCMQCHSPRWANNYLARYDQAVQHYNDTYFAPVKSIMDDLYAKNVLTRWPAFDEEIEWTFYEFWHNEGRRARMGSAMMGPDYSWWHGFYDLKKTFRGIVEQAEEAKKSGHGTPVFVPGAGGANLTKDQAEPFPAAWDKVKNLKGK